MATDEILGRNVEHIKRYGKEGTAYMGRIVTYPGGKYEEVGDIFLDITNPHCMLVLGKRGTGKSYTLGVLSEEFLELDDDISERLSVIIVDTMSVFHSLKTANTNEAEIDQMGRFTKLHPKGYDNKVKIFIPKIAEDLVKESGYDMLYDSYLTFSLSDIEINDWLTVFNLRPTEPVGVLISRVIGILTTDKEPFDFENIYQTIERQESFNNDVKSALIEMMKIIEKMEVFERLGTQMSDIVKGGRVSVLDISSLGRISGYDIRSLLISIIAKKLLFERIVFSTVEMQSEAGLIDAYISKDITKDHPLVYMLIDEAHLFLPANGRTFSSDVLIDWIKLGRHPGLSLVMATQEPSALHSAALRQADIIISHNITSQDDIDALGRARQTYMTRARSIEEIVSQMDPRRGLSVIFDDVKRKMEYCLVRPRRTIHTGVDASAIKWKDQKKDIVYDRKIKIYKR